MQELKGLITLSVFIRAAMTTELFDLLISRGWHNDCVIAR